MLCAKCVNKVEKIRICLGDAVIEDNDHDQVRQFGGALNKMEYFFFLISSFTFGKIKWPTKMFRVIDDPYF